MSDLELCYLPAVKALELFKARKLSPVELMQAVIARAEAVEPLLGHRDAQVAASDRVSQLWSVILVRRHASGNERSGRGNQSDETHGDQDFHSHRISPNGNGVLPESKRYGIANASLSLTT